MTLVQSLLAFDRSLHSTLNRPNCSIVGSQLATSLPHTKHENGPDRLNSGGFPEASDAPMLPGDPTLRRDPNLRVSLPGPVTASASPLLPSF